MPLDIDIRIDNEAGEKMLEDVSLESFTASPANIRPFETAELAWRIEAPSGVTATLNGATVPLSGSKTVELLSNTTFVLGVHALAASRTLGRRTVTVETDQCVEVGIVGNAIENSIEAEINNQVPTSGKVRRRGDGRATYSKGRIAVEVPLRLEIPNFFDADADIRIEIAIANSLGDRPQMRLVDVDFDLDLGADATIIGTLVGLLAGSAATTVTVEKVVEAVLDEFLEVFVARPLVTELADAIQAQVRELCPEGMATRSILTFDTGLAVTCCPTPDDDANVSGVRGEAVVALPSVLLAVSRPG